MLNHQRDAERERDEGRELWHEKSDLHEHANRYNKSRNRAPLKPHKQLSEAVA